MFMNVLCDQLICIFTFYYNVIEIGQFFFSIQPIANVREHYNISTITNDSDYSRRFLWMPTFNYNRGEGIKDSNLTIFHAKKTYFNSSVRIVLITQ